MCRKCGRFATSEMRTANQQPGLAIGPGGLRCNRNVA